MNWRHFLLINVLAGLPPALAVPKVRRADDPISVPSIVSHPTSLPHSSYTATPTTSGAERASSVGSGIPTLGLAPGATSYPSDGKLHDPQPAPYTPAGGVGTNGTTPIYNAKSDFDYESLALALYLEYIELDLFHDGLARFSVAEFTAAGLTAEDRFLIEFMVDQEVGHATMLTNILGAQAPRQCVYNYPYATVHEFIDFCQKLTRFGEAGVLGFLPHLDSREAAGLLAQSITTEARQQMIFRQFEGLFPVPVWFEVGVPQSWVWTLLAPYISYCPANQTRLAWQNFPSLYIENQPNPYRVNGSSSANETLPGGGMNALASRNVTGPESCLNKTAVGESCSPAITHNRTSPLSYPGRTVTLSWDAPGKGVGPNNSYITNTTAGSPSYVLWASQLNVTYSTLTISGNSSYGTTIQPDLSTYAGDPALNGTIFIAITDTDLFVTPFNISSVNSHIVAGPALYQAG
ncbi:ferritin-like domain-containing protein [Aspergillus novofumigatus IBT 16806]|uniref:Putative stress response protein Rds1 n=1 Tax=Aspergillus novofumigatus (strain IBT 16806) TaxID=1392255 RepID=A0A2I1CIU0_ASPN1|nr:putative stress response protein Rds1 [Aspergillus novofumigatus IBT 16806]PKX97543.1 putative stress response protein Rds1 [Aspergillus novofumigatus IBT 16806]